MKNYPFRNLLILSLTLNLLSIIVAGAIIVGKGGLPWLTHRIAHILRTNQASTNIPNNRLSVFEQLSVGPGDIVFLGDSILNFGEWHEFLDDNRAKNRGITQDDTHAILNRLSTIIAGRPRHIVILCGINNFYEHIPYSQTTNEYAQIVAAISSQSPNTDVWLLPVLPVNVRLHKQWVIGDDVSVIQPKQTEVEALNAFIENLSVDKPRIHFVGLPELLDQSGELRDDYTLDGLHLNGRGLKEIATRLEQLGIKEAKD